jgi:hypothetical protein
MAEARRLVVKVDMRRAREAKDLSLPRRVDIGGEGELIVRA